MWIMVLNVNGRVIYEKSSSKEAIEKAMKYWLSWARSNYPHKEFTPELYAIDDPKPCV